MEETILNQFFLQVGYACLTNCSLCPSGRSATNEETNNMRLDTPSAKDFRIIVSPDFVFPPTSIAGFFQRNCQIRLADILIRDNNLIGLGSHASILIYFML